MSRNLLRPAPLMILAIVATTLPEVGLSASRTAAAAPRIVAHGVTQVGTSAELVAVAAVPAAHVATRFDVATPGTKSAEALAGDVAVTLYDCPSGMRPESLAPEQCQLSTEPLAELEIAPLGSGPAEPRSLREARRDGDTLVWDDLPFDEYVVWARSLDENYDRFRIPDREGLNTPPELGYTASPNEGYIVALSADAPAADLAVYLFHTS